MKKLLLRASSMLAPTTLAFAQSSYDTYSYTNDTASAGFFGGLMLIYCVCFIAGFALLGVVSYLVYKDAKKNNVDNPILWALLTFFLGLLGVLLYLFVGKNQKNTKA